MKGQFPSQAGVSCTVAYLDSSTWEAWQMVSVHFAWLTCCSGWIQFTREIRRRQIQLASESGHDVPAPAIPQHPRRQIPGDTKSELSAGSESTPISSEALP